jgi:hypothetical protein
LNPRSPAYRAGVLTIRPQRPIGNPQLFSLLKPKSSKSIAARKLGIGSNFKIKKALRLYLKKGN